MRAITLRERRHRLRSSLGQNPLCFAQGRWDTGDPFRTRRDELLEILGTLEGTVGHQRGSTIGGGEVRNGVPDARTALLGITAIATERRQQDRDTGLVLHKQLQHHVVESRALIATRAAGDGHNGLLRLLVTVGAPIDMEPRAIEMGKAGRKAQALGSRGSNATVECRHPIGVERLQGTPERVILAMGWPEGLGR